MMRKQMVSSNELCYEEFKYAQDYALFLRISEPFPVDNLSERLYYHRLNSQAISSRHLSEQVRMGLIISEASRLRRKGLLGKWDEKQYQTISETL